MDFVEKGLGNLVPYHDLNPSYHTSLTLILRYKGLIEPINLDVIRQGDVLEYMWGLVKAAMSCPSALNCVDISSFDIDDAAAADHVKAKIEDVKAVLMDERTHTELQWLREEYGLCFAWEEQNKRYWQMQHGVFGDKVFKKWRADLEELRHALSLKLKVDI